MVVGESLALHVATTGLSDLAFEQVMLSAFRCPALAPDLGSQLFLARASTLSYGQDRRSFERSLNHASSHDGVAISVLADLSHDEFESLWVAYATCATLTTALGNLKKKISAW